MLVKALQEMTRSFPQQPKKFNLLIVPATSFGCPGYVRYLHTAYPMR